MQSSSSRRWKGETLNSPRHRREALQSNSSSTLLSNSDSRSSSSNKQVLSFQELFGEERQQHSSSSSGTRRSTLQRTSSEVRTATSNNVTASSSAMASPLQQRIRQQILKSNEESKQQSKMAVSNTSAAAASSQTYHHPRSSGSPSRLTQEATSIRKSLKSPAAPSSSFRCSTAMASLKSPSPALKSSGKTSGSNNTAAERRQRYIEQRVEEARKALASSNNNAAVRRRTPTERPTAGDSAFFTPSPPPATTTSASSLTKSRRRGTVTSSSLSSSKRSISSSHSGGVRSVSSQQKFLSANKSAALAASTEQPQASGETTQRRRSSSVRTPPLLPSSTTTSKTAVSSASRQTKSGAKRTSSTTPGLRVRTIRTPLSSNHGGGSLSKQRSVSSEFRKNKDYGMDDDDDTGPSTRRNLDKRTARLKYGGDFASEIDRYMAGIGSMTSPIAAALTPKNHPSSGKKSSSSSPSLLKVYVRKRPVFAPQLENGDFDVVQILNGNDVSEENDGTTSASAVVVYRTYMACDIKTKMVQPVVFSQGVTAAFDDQTGSEKVYRTAVLPLVQSVLGGKAATLLMFGQTGSGKTYTMTACQKLVAAELFASHGVKRVQVQCLELTGKRCRDLMRSDEQADGGEVRILDNDDGSVTFVNAATFVLDSPRELVAVLLQSQERRATHATEVNDVSSRSHAIFQIRTINGSLDHGSSTGGVLTLLDCAGTERRNDSLFHSKERQTESAEINASLYALKECIRVRTRNSKTKQKIHVPYRSSNLTRILRESLECDDAHLAVIATISPNATDTEHTIQTLKTLCNLTGTEWCECDSEKLSDHTSAAEPALPPKKWDHDGLVRWLSARSLLGSSPVPTELDGKSIMRMSKIRLRNALYDNEIGGGGNQSAAAVGMEKADRLFQCLRAESDRVARLEWQRRMGD